MRLLIIEDHSFNAFCLRRLLSDAFNRIQISVVDNSQDAITAVEKQLPDYVILDGDLRAHDGLHCNGPTLADTLWTNYSELKIIAWTDSDIMRTAFSKVFKQHGKMFNEHVCWTKVVSQERIRRSFFYLEGQFIKSQDLIYGSPFANREQTQYG